MNKIFGSQSFIKTSSGKIILLTLLFSFLPMLIIWLLIGEFNLINEYWLIPSGADLWHGTFTSADIDSLVTRFGSYSDNLEFNLNQWLNGDTPLDPIVIRSTRLIFNPLILACLFSVVLFNLIYPFIFKLLKFSNVDLFSFAITSSLAMLLLIMTGLIPIWSPNIKVLWWIIRIAIVAIGSIVLFIIINNIINLIIIKSSYSNKYAEAIINQNKDIEFAKNDLKESLKIWNDSKNNIEYVDVEIKENKEKKK